MPKTKPEPRELFEITATAFVSFYVEAESQEGALSSPALDTNCNPRWHGTFEWEHDETTAKPVGAEQAGYIRKYHPEQIAE